MIRMPGVVNRDVVVGAEAEGARRATGDSGPMTTSRASTPTPDPEVAAKPQRRRFTAEYRLRILKEADACKKPGDARTDSCESSHCCRRKRCTGPGVRAEAALMSLTRSHSTWRRTGASLCWAEPLPMAPRFLPALSTCQWPTLAAA